MWRYVIQLSINIHTYVWNFTNVDKPIFNTDSCGTVGCSTHSLFVCLFVCVCVCVCV